MTEAKTLPVFEQKTFTKEAEIVAFKKAMILKGYTSGNADTRVPDQWKDKDSIIANATGEVQVRLSRRDDKTMYNVHQLECDGATISVFGGDKPLQTGKRYIIPIVPNQYKDRDGEVIQGKAFGTPTLEKIEQSRLKTEKGK